VSEVSESGSSFIRGGRRLARFSCSLDFLAVLVFCVGFRMLDGALPFILWWLSEGSDLGAIVLSLEGLGWEGLDWECLGWQILGCEVLGGTDLALGGAMLVDAGDESDEGAVALVDLVDAGVVGRETLLVETGGGADLGGVAFQVKGYWAPLRVLSLLRCG